MRTAYMMLSLMVLAFGTAASQQADSASVRADSLRHRIEERFAVRAQERLGLTDDQTAKLRATSKQFAIRRGELRTRGRGLREALTAQLKPGVAANQDSVAKLTDAMIELRLAETQLSRDEIRDQAKYLSPVQRAQLYVMRERFAHRVREVHEHRGKRGMPRVHEHRGERKQRRPGARQQSGDPQALPQQGSGRI